LIEAPPEPPRPDELELLIREARARQRKRRLGTVVLVAGLAGAVLGISSVLARRTPSASTGSHQRSGATSAGRCGITVDGVRVLRGRRLVYREPASRTFGHEVRCSGATVWVVFFNGVASSQEAYFGVRSGDSGHSWRAVFAARYFNVKAPHQLVTGYLGPWTLDGARDAYFTGMCVACGLGTVSLWVTRDAGRTFRRYNLPLLTGYRLTRIRASGRGVIIRARRGARKTGPRDETVRVRIA
jgi:hypothetical protein